MNYEADSLQAKSEQQKETMFENVFIPVEDTYRDYMDCKIPKSQKIISCIFGGFSVLISVFAIIAYVRGDMGAGVIAVATTFLLFAALSLIGTFSVKRQDLERKIKEERLRNSGKEGDFACIKTNFIEESFRTTDGAIYQYDQISKLLVSRDYLFIIIEEMISTAIKKNAFTLGDYESFVVFLREKFKEMDKAHLWVKLVDEK